MSNRILVLFLISLMLSIVTYIALDNYIYACAVLVLSILVVTTLISPIMASHQIKVRKYHECYHFINNFVIALSIKKSIAGSLESTVSSMPNEFTDIYNGLENMSNKEKMNYLSTYFKFHVYQLFLQIVELWEENGGDILKMSKYLISETRLNEEYITKADSMASHKYVEIGILWGFCCLIVIILRFSLKDFYDKIKSQLVFIIAILGLMVFILFSMYLLVRKGTKLQLKGYVENEKNI